MLGLKLNHFSKRGPGEFSRASPGFLAGTWVYIKDELDTDASIEIYKKRSVHSIISKIKTEWW